MSSNNSLDLSIQLQENQQKSKEQELQEFVQLTKKIAESDRNNDLLREIKKNKMNEVHKIRALHRNVLDENQTLQTELTSLVDSIKQTKMMQKNKTDYYEQLSKRYDELTLKQKHAEEKNAQLTKQNDNLEKKVLALQRQYDEIIKGNKEKSNYLQKLQTKKKLQDELINQSKKKIQKLEQLCETTKVKAIQLEEELKQRAESTKKLQALVAEKQREAELFRKEKQEGQKKQEETKRITNKLVARIKVIEEQIDQKVEEFSRLQSIHSRLQLQIEKIEKSQDLFQQLLMKRRQIVRQLKKDSSKLSKQKEITKNLRQF